MIDKVQKIREEVERLMYGFNLKADVASCEDAKTEELANIKYQICKKILDYIDEVQKEPVSEKKCIFTKDSYTDEDRKILCEDCKEKCGYSKKEEPVSDDLEKASTKYAQDKYMPVQTSQAFKAGAKWQKEKEYTCYEEAFEDGAKWKKEQMMKNAVDGWVFRDIKEGKLRISDNKECWNGIRIPEKSIEKSYLFCTSDDAIKVKLVIVKED